jgi:hypothetical protein
VWTVDTEFDQPIRHFDFNRSGGSFYAAFTLRFTPYLDDNEARFVNGLEGEEEKHWGAYIENGVKEFLDQRAQEGKTIGCLRVTLVSIKIHPVDSKGHRYKQAAVLAMEKAFESHGIWLE